MSETKKTIDPSMVRELAAILREADLDEIEVEHGPLRVRVTKSLAAPAQTVYAAAPAMAPAPMAAPAAPAPSSAPVAPAAAAADDAITSPMVGTVYLSPEPGAAAFVKVGDTVKAGQTLMLIEAMKTFNPVTAPAAGKVEAILAEDAQPVEYGEPLIVVR